MFAVKKIIIIISLLVAILFGIISVVLFVTYKDTNNFINQLATILLSIGLLIIIWLRFYSNIKPVWVGIIFSIILFVAFWLVSLIIHHVNPQSSGYLIAIPIVFALAVLLNFFEDRISNIFMFIANILKL